MPPTPHTRSAPLTLPHIRQVTEGGALYVWGCNEGLQLGLEGAGKNDVIELPTSTLQGVQAAACSNRPRLGLRFGLG